MPQFALGPGQAGATGAHFAECHAILVRWSYAAVSVLNYEQLDGPTGRERLRQEIIHRRNAQVKTLGLVGQVVDVQFYEPLIK